MATDFTFRALDIDPDKMLFTYEDQTGKHTLQGGAANLKFREYVQATGGTGTGLNPTIIGQWATKWNATNPPATTTTPSGFAPVTTQPSSAQLATAMAKAPTTTATSEKTPTAAVSSKVRAYTFGADGLLANDKVNSQLTGLYTVLESPTYNPQGANGAALIDSYLTAKTAFDAANANSALSASQKYQYELAYKRALYAAQQGTSQAALSTADSFYATRNAAMTAKPATTAPASGSSVGSVPAVTPTPTVSTTKPAATVTAPTSAPAQPTVKNVAAAAPTVQAPVQPTVKQVATNTAITAQAPAVVAPAGGQSQNNSQSGSQTPKRAASTMTQTEQNAVWQANAGYLQKLKDQNEAIKNNPNIPAATKALAQKALDDAWLDAVERAGFDVSAQRQPAQQVGDPSVQLQDVPMPADAAQFANDPKVKAAQAALTTLLRDPKRTNQQVVQAQLAVRSAISQARNAANPAGAGKPVDTPNPPANPNRNWDPATQARAAGVQGQQAINAIDVNRAITSQGQAGLVPLTRTGQSIYTNLSKSAEQSGGKALTAFDQTSPAAVVIPSAQTISQMTGLSPGNANLFSSDLRRALQTNTLEQFKTAARDAYGITDASVIDRLLAVGAESGAEAATGLQWSAEQPVRNWVTTLAPGEEGAAEGEGGQVVITGGGGGVGGVASNFADLYNQNMALFTGEEGESEQEGGGGELGAGTESVAPEVAAAPVIEAQPTIEVQFGDRVANAAEAPTPQQVAESLNMTPQRADALSTRIQWLLQSGGASKGEVADLAKEFGINATQIQNLVGGGR